MNNEYRENVPQIGYPLASPVNTLPTPEIKQQYLLQS